MLLLLSCLIFFQLVHSQIPVHIATKKGPIVGMSVAPNISTTNTGFDAFLGIPYGDKPNRFQVAKGRSAWTDPLITQSDGPMCPQPSAEFDEDCLYLNVFTPPGASVRATSLPVMVYVHGGSFRFGSSSSKECTPDFLISSGIILVTFNYRLGATGFLSLGTKVAPGNLGLHDTLLVLQWVQDEITAFGGDPRQVTLAGHSAGSLITHVHYLSPLSIGLFQRAIGQSGSALMDCCYTTGTEARRRALLLAQRLNCDTSQNDTTILACLQKADIKDVVANQVIPLSDYDEITARTIPFVPVLDTSATADKPFFSDSLENLIKAAAVRAKPLLSGFTTDEGIILLSMSAYQKAEANIPAFLPEGDRTSTKVNSIQTHYFNESPTLNKMQSLVSLYSEFYFIYPIVKEMRHFANFSYGYLFAFDGSWGSLYHTEEMYRYRMIGVTHGEDLTYLFYRGQPLDTCEANINNVNMSRNMVKWWTNFVKTGVPDDSWPTIAKGGYFVIDSQTSIRNVTEFESQYYDFWASMENKTNSSADYATNTFYYIILFIIYRFYYSH